MRSNRRGFTLFEILIASALVGMLMIAINTFIFSMTELWGGRRDERNFDLHVGNVTQYLQHMMNVAMLPPYGPPASTTTTSTLGVTWQTPATQPQAVDLSNTNGQYLTFTLPAEEQVLLWPGHTLPDVSCALAYTAGQGLELLYHSQYETTFSTDAPRVRVISPLVTALEYDYFDSTQQQWTSTDQVQTDPNTGSPLLPNRLRLTFTYGNLSREAIVIIPFPAQGLPAY